MLVVVDTNIWISATLSPSGFCAPVLAAVRADRFTPAFCGLTQHELTDVLTRPSILRRYRLPPEDIASLLMLTGEKGLRIDDPVITRISRDPRDDVFIALAAASGAEYLVTRDDDLKRDLAVVEHLAASGCEVISVRTFLERLAD